MDPRDIEILELRRKIAGLTQAALAKRAKVSYQRLWRACTGDGRLTGDEAASLSAALDAAELEQDQARNALAVLRMAYA